MKSKIAKGIFYLSFIPYILLLLLSIYSAFEGFTFLFSTSYGIEAFFETFIFVGAIFCIIPVFPVCICYEIGYGIYQLKKRKGEVNTKKYVMSCAAVLAAIAVAGVLCILCAENFEQVTKLQVRRFADRAGETIAYGPVSYDEYGGMLGLEEYKSGQIFIDYKRKQIGFFVDYSWGKFSKYKLRKDGKQQKKTAYDEKYALQAVIPLNAPGGCLYTYSVNRGCVESTCAVILEMADGSCYYSEHIIDQEEGYYLYTRLDESVFAKTERW